MKLLELSCPVYGVLITVALDCGHEEIKCLLEESGCKKIDEVYDASERNGGCLLSFENSTYLLWLRNSSDLQFLVHETGHLTFAVLQDRGIELSRESEEAFTYYQGWLAQSIQNFLFEHAQKMKVTKKKATAKKKAVEAAKIEKSKSKSKRK